MALAAVARPQTPQSATRFEPTLSQSTSSPDKGGEVDVKPSRPPPRALIHRSTFDLEPNPFEQSFSRSSASVPRTGGGGGGGGDRSPTPGSPHIPALKSPRQSTSPPGQASNKPVLPPLASLASPSAPGQGPWYHSDLSSLRSGPLSPAMLAGPRTKPSTGLTPFVGTTDPAAFRTGLTPDVGRTGLTPLVGGPGFPPPSPNTAAFFAMTSQSGITPGTLNALTSVLNTVDQSTAAPAPHPLSVSHVPAPYQNDPAYAKYYPGPSNGLPSQQPPSTTLQAPTPVQQSSAAPPSDPYAPAAATATAHAATGLFLLSQAHHELTKREEMARLAAQQQAQAEAQQQQGGHHSQQQQQRDHRSRRMSTVSAISTADHQQSMSPIVKRKSPPEHQNQHQHVLHPQQQDQLQQQQAPATAAKPSRSSKRTKSNRQKRRDSDADMEAAMDEMGLGMGGMGMDGMDGMDGFDMHGNPLNGGYGGMEMDMDGSGRGGVGGMVEGAHNPGTIEVVKRVETDEEKRKNFLERNRQAALKCRQRKKAWLTQLQQKVEYLTAENERLSATLSGARDEVQRLTAALVSHRDCPLHHNQSQVGGVGQEQGGRGGQTFGPPPAPPVVVMNGTGSQQPVSVSVAVPGQGQRGGGGFGY